MKKKIFIVLCIVAFVIAIVVIFAPQNALRKPSAKSSQAIELLSKLEPYYPKAEVSIEDPDQIGLNIGNWQVFFSKKKDLDLQVRALQAVVQQLRMDESKHLSIDLRFNKVVIKNL